MRILLANTGHPATIKGGAEAAVLDLGHALARRGHETALVVHHAGRGLTESVDGGVRVYGLPNRNLYFGFDGKRRPAPLRLAWHAIDGTNPFMAQMFGAILDRERPDVLNTHVVVGLSQLVWREAARRGIPVVHYLHEYGSMCPRGSAFRDGKLCRTPCGSCRILGWPRKRLSGLVDTVVGVSRFTLERHLSWGLFPKAERRVIPNVFTGLATRARSDRVAGPLRLGYFGRLIHDKGAHLVIDALRGLPGGEVTLDIAGTGDDAYVEQLRSVAPANVRFLGWTAAKDFFPSIDILVVPSLWPDPQPRVVFEAYSHGVPVVGARSGGIPEQVDEGRTGWLFDPQRVEDLPALLAARLADRADLGIAGADLEARLDRLDPDLVIRQYESAFEAALARNQASPAPAAPGHLIRRGVP